MTKSRFFKTIIFLAIINLAIIVVWVVVLFLIQNDRQVLQEERDEAGQMFNSQNNLTNLSPDKITALNNYFLTGSSTIKFLEQIEGVGKQTGAKLQIGQAVENGAELQLQLSALGTYAQVTKLLASLENLPYAVKISRFDLSTDGKVWTGSFTLVILTDKNV